MPQTYRQIIPTIAGAYAKPLLTTQASLTPADVVRVDIPLSLKASGSGYYLALTFSDLSLLQFPLDLVYADGKTETFRFNRSNRVPNSGRYYLELNKSYSASLAAVTLPKGSGRATVALCQTAVP